MEYCKSTLKTQMIVEHRETEKTYNRREERKTHRNENCNRASDEVLFSDHPILGVRENFWEKQAMGVGEVYIYLLNS
jgi:hypothetical protein